MEPNQSPEKTKLDRREILKLLGFGAGLFLVGKYIAKEQQESANWQDTIKVKEKNNTNSTEYIFTLSANPSGELFDKLQRLEQKTGKSSFSILVNPSKDSTFSRLSQEVLTDSVTKQFKSTSIDKGLELITSQVLSVFKKNNIQYYSWFDSDENLEYFFTHSNLLGERIEKSLTCYEGAVFTKEILKELDVETQLTFQGVHVNLAYENPNGQTLTIEPLIGKVLNQKSN
jgi:hypothetical protein